MGAEQKKRGKGREGRREGGAGERGGEGEGERGVKPLPTGRKTVLQLGELLLPLGVICN